MLKKARMACLAYMNHPPCRCKHIRTANPIERSFKELKRRYLITEWRRFSERLGGGASIFQDLDLGEALSAEAKLRPTEGGGKHPPEAKSFGKSSAEDLKRREMPPPPVTSYKRRVKVMEHFPTEESSIRILYRLLQTQNETLEARPIGHFGIYTNW